MRVRAATAAWCWLRPAHAGEQYFWCFFVVAKCSWQKSHDLSKIGFSRARMRQARLQ